MNNPAFDGISVILPAFCREMTASWTALLRRAMTSVLEQACPLPLELILVDDGSVSPIRDFELLADVFADPRVRIIRLQRNSGLVFALNAGLNLARYDLIARIDSDDVWRPGKLVKQLAVFDRDPDVAIVGTGMRLVHEGREGVDQDLIRPGTWSGILRFTAEVGCPFPHGGILARKSVYHLMGGYSHDVRTAHCEDFALWSVWLRFFKGAAVEEVLYEYTVSDGAVSAVHAGQQRLASGRVHAAYLALPYSEIPDAMARVARMLNRSMFETGRICFLVWRFYEAVLADAEFINDLRILLPDRQVMRVSDADNHLGDRFFYFSESPCDAVRHARGLHTINTLESLRMD